MAVLVAAVALGFGAGHGNAQKPLAVTEVWTFGNGIQTPAVRRRRDRRNIPWHGAGIRPMAEAVYAIDPQLGTVTRIARSGEGPGEVKAPDRIAVMPYGNMAVFNLHKVEV